MQFFGREREIQVAEAMIGMREGAACVFVGDTGVGKTALVREIARRHDTAVVAVSPSERMWPLSGVSAFAAGLTGSRSSALDAVLSRGRDWPEHLLAEEISRTLHLVQDEPRVLVIDDLDEMDGASLSILAFVCARLRGTGVSVIATVRTPEGRHDFAGVTHIHIERLSFDESVELARATIGAGTSPAVTHIVAASTGGDPGLIARVRLTPGEAAGDDALPLPLRVVRPSVRRQRSMPRCSEDPRVSAVLDLLSMGPLYDYEHLRSAAAEIGIELDELIDRGLVSVHGDRARVSDPALRLRHHAALSPAERRRLHARSASDHRRQDPATYLWHASFLDPTGDRLPLLAAAVELSRGGDTFAAIEFAERALGGELDPIQRDRGLVELGDALVLGGHDLLGQHYLDRALDTAAADVRVRATIAALRAGARVDHVVRDALPESVEWEDDAVSTERLLCESARLHLSRGELEQAVARVSAVVERGAVSEETLLLAAILRGMGMEVPDDLPDTVDLEVGLSPDAPIELASLAVTVLLLDERYAEVRRVTETLLSSMPRPAPMWRERLLRIVVAAEVRGGDPLAARHAVAAWRHEWLPGRGPDAARTLLLAQAAAIDPSDPTTHDLVRRGRELCRREGTPTLLPFFAAIEGGLALTERRFDDAVGSLQAARAAGPGNDPALMRTDADLIEALWLSDRVVEARSETARLEVALAARPRRWTTLAVARSRAVCRSGREGRLAFDEAQALYRTDDSPHEYARLRAARERCVPADEYRVLRRVGYDARADTVLSPEEQEVVALVQRGLRNREIAATLFISLRSVELRLTRVYRKLGVGSRAQLVAHLHGEASA
ncbi:AAA family ATPase [Microbacterium proteolyticum]|uniref:helix-turn-helix transcriptional regulator n=1 Tax=Microbacterium proteolyticum TaxID=1572644 RepID=UPI002416C086|nr:LuxR family transcriptional regulator [Microbacterium proteolyticum]